MRTVRSVAQARNRPRPRLGWLLLLVAILLLLLTARIAAAMPADDGDGEDRDDIAEVDRDGSQRDAVEAAELAEALATWDAEVRGDDGSSFDPTFTAAGSAEAREARRRRGRSRLGQIEVALTWRRRWAERDEALVLRDEVWLVATWRI